MQTKRCVLSLALLLLLPLLLGAHTLHATQLEACGYHNLPLVMEQVPESWEWYVHNYIGMATYNRYMNIYQQREDDGSWGRNYYNEFGGFPSDSQLDDLWGFHWNGYLALTCIRMYTTVDCSEIAESDIVFNPAYTWTGDRDYAEDNPDTVVYYDANLLHELGHSWGMQTRNEDYTYYDPTVMHSYVAHSVQDFHTIHVPEAYLIRRQYDNQRSIKTLRNMVVVSKYADGTWKNATTDRTDYFAGDSMTISNMTIENTGTENLANVHVRFYLSTVRTVTRYDTKIGDFFWDSFPAESYGVWDFTVTIPETVRAGTYYVGAWITKNGYDPDDIASDNKTHLWTRINVSHRTIEVTSPTIGDTWYIGDTHTIQWNSFEAGSYVKIRAQRYYEGRYIWDTITESTPNDGSYTWTVTRPAANSSRIWITSVDYPFVDAFGSVKIKDPEITVASPNGGEAWQAGSVQAIRWTYLGNPGPEVHIDLMKGGASDRRIASNVPLGTGGEGSYGWAIPVDLAPGNDYRIRVRHPTNWSYKDTSDSDFKILSPLQVIAPNGGEKFYQGGTMMIQWTYQGQPGGNVRIELWTKLAFVSLITEGTSIGSSGSGSYTWSIPVYLPRGRDYKVKVTSTTNRFYTDKTNGSFTIARPKITVQSPAVGETWQAATTQVIGWTYEGDLGPDVKIELFKGDVLSRVVTPSTPVGGHGMGSYNWTIPVDQVPGTNYRIKVTSLRNTSWNNFMDGYFKIIGPLKVTSPNGREIWKTGTTHTIGWTYTGNPQGFVKIELLKGGVVKSTITPSTPIGAVGAPGIGSYEWSIPSTQRVGEDYKIRVTSTSNEAYQDQSDRCFGIWN